MGSVLDINKKKQVIILSSGDFFGDRLSIVKEILIIFRLLKQLKLTSRFHEIALNLL